MMRTLGRRHIGKLRDWILILNSGNNGRLQRAGLRILTVQQRVVSGSLINYYSILCLCQNFQGRLWTFSSQCFSPFPWVALRFNGKLHLPHHLSPLGPRQCGWWRKVKNDRQIYSRPKEDLQKKARNRLRRFYSRNTLLDLKFEF